MRIHCRSLIVLVLAHALTSAAYGQQPAFPDGTVERLRARQLSDFAADPQIIARVAATELSTPDLVTQIARTLRKQVHILADDDATAFEDFRIMKTLPSGEMLVTFRLSLRDTALHLSPATTTALSHQMIWESVHAGLMRLEQAGLVVWAEAVARDYFLSATANDPFFNSTGAWAQPYLDLWGLHLIGAPTAWDLTTGDEDLVIGIVDSGIDYTHPDLHRNMWVNPAEVADNNTDGKIDVDDIDTNLDGLVSAAELSAVSDGLDGALGGNPPNGKIDDIFGYDFFYDDGVPRDFYGHGTHIAGTIGAVGNNNLGITGINWQCKMLSSKAFGDSAQSNTAALAEALIYAVDEGARILNCSWGSLVESQAILDAIDYAYDNDVIVVFASGNFGIDSQYVFPNSHRTLTINASSQADTITIFSDFGHRTDVAAPGGGMTDDPLEARNVLSTMASSSFFTSSLGTYHVGSQYLRIAGTSMAAPHAVGALGLILALNPGLSVEEARQVLRWSAADHGAPGWDPMFGYGRVDVASALLVTNPVECRISAPASGTRRDQLEDPTQVLIDGTARSSNDPATTYRVDYRLINAGSWIQIQDWTAAAIADGNLATWDMTSLSDGNYEVRLQVQDSLGRIFEDRIALAVPPPPMPGWPRVFASGSNNFGAPLIDDLDGDGSAEVIVSMGGELCVLDHLGQDVAGWPQNSAVFGPGGQFRGTPVIGDFDPGYPGREIVAVHWASAGNTLNVNVFHADGTRRLDHNWPIQISGTGVVGQRISPALADLDQDGDLELVVYLWSSAYVFDQQGTDITSAGLAAQNLAHTADGSMMAVGDINNDSLPDIVFARRSTLTNFDLIAYDINGQLVMDVDLNTLMAPHVTPAPDRFAISALCLADLDSDPELEVIAIVGNEAQVGNGFQFRDQEMIALNADGTFVSGAWPVHVDPSGVAQLFPGVISYVIAGDIDRDGTNEIIGATLNQLTVLRADGSDFGSTFLGLEFESPPIAGDLDGSAATDELVASSLFGTVFGFSLDGTQVDGFPLGTNSSSIFLTAAPALGDIDGDGLLELVIKEPSLGFPSPQSFVTAYDVNGQPGATWPMYHGMPEGRNAVEGCAPPHDECSGALIVDVGTTLGSLACATNDGVASCGTSSTNVDLWYQYTAPCAGSLTIDTCGSNDSGGIDAGSDLVLAIYSQCPGDLTSELVCNDNWPTSSNPAACSADDQGALLDAAATIAMTEAQTVWIRVSHSGATAAGTFVLNVDYDCACDDITDLSCAVAGLDISLTWTNNESYDAVTVFRDGIVLATLTPATQAYTDVAPPSGTHSYSVQGDCAGLLTHLTDTVECAAGPEFRRGDCNADGGQDIADAVKVLAFLFPVGAPPTLLCVDACDANDDSSVNVADAVRILTALFGMPASPLPAPYPGCGVDPTALDAIDCSAYPACP
ncbi:MAG: S8 family serine peptidase [Planctomycetota bacterium]